MLAWAWHEGDTPHHLVIVNFSPHAAQGLVSLPWPELAHQAWRLTDLLDGRVFERDGDDMVRNGLYVDLPQWGVHVLSVE